MIAAGTRAVRPTRILSMKRVVFRSLAATSNAFPRFVPRLPGNATRAVSIRIHSLLQARFPCFDIIRIRNLRVGCAMLSSERQSCVTQLMLRNGLLRNQSDRLPTGSLQFCRELPRQTPPTLKGRSRRADPDCPQHNVDSSHDRHSKSRVCCAIHALRRIFCVVQLKVAQWAIAQLRTLAVR